MLGFSLGEILFLAVLALVVIGPKQLPEVARQVAKFLNELKRTTSGLTEELKRQARIDLETPTTPQPAAPPPVAPPPDLAQPPGTEPVTAAGDAIHPSGEKRES